MYDWLWAWLGPMIVITRNRILDELDLRDNAVVVDLFFSVVFMACSIIAWCCMFRHAQDFAFVLIKLMFFVFIGLVLTNITTLLISVSAQEHELVRAVLNKTGSVIREQLLKV